MAERSEIPPSNPPEEPPLSGSRSATPPPYSYRKRVYTHNVSCDTCGALPPAYCKGFGSEYRRYHIARLRAAKFVQQLVDKYAP